MTRQQRPESRKKALNAPRFAMILMPVLLLLLAGLPAQATGLNDVIRALETPFKETAADQGLQRPTFSRSRGSPPSIVSSGPAGGSACASTPLRPFRSGADVMFHWEYEEPTTQEIISDGKTLWVYLPENNQVIQSDVEMVSKARENNPMTFLTGLGESLPRFPGQLRRAEPRRRGELCTRSAAAPHHGVAQPHGHRGRSRCG